MRIEESCACFRAAMLGSLFAAARRSVRRNGPLSPRSRLRSAGGPDVHRRSPAAWSVIGGEHTDGCSRPGRRQGYERRFEGPATGRASSTESA